MQEMPTLVIDFDSTFVQIETFDAMIEVLNLEPEARKSLQAEISKLTHQAMTGEMGFAEALQIRLQRLKFHRAQLKAVIEYLQQRITPSFLQHKDFFSIANNNIYIFSGGFSEIIEPIVSSWGIKTSHIYANRLSYDEQGWVNGADETILMSQDQGKLKQINQMPVDNVLVLGDGYTDIEMKLSPKVKQVYLFCENIRREKLIPESDKCIYSFTDFLTEIGYKP